MSTPQDEIKKMHRSRRKQGNPYETEKVENNSNEIRKVNDWKKKILSPKTVYVSERIEKLANDLDLFVRKLVEEAQAKQMPNQVKVINHGIAPRRPDPMENRNRITELQTGKQNVLAEIAQSIPSLRITVAQLPDYQQKTFNSLLDKLQSMVDKV